MSAPNRFRIFQFSLSGKGGSASCKPAQNIPASPLSFIVCGKHLCILHPRRFIPMCYEAQDCLVDFGKL